VERPGEAQTLVAIAHTLTETHDLTEALRQTCRHLARFTGAETVSAHLLDRGRTALLPVAGYHMPREALPVLASQPVPIQAQGFRDSLLGGEITWSDDVPHDPRFAFPLFRQFPHRSGLIIPLRSRDEMAGAIYLVWWTEARRFGPAEVTTLQAIGQQVGLLLHGAVLRLEAEQRRAEAEAAEARYRNLVEHVPAGVWRTTLTGEIVEINPALVQMLGYPDRASLLAVRSPDLYVDPADRERLRQTLARDGAADFTTQLRRADGTPVWTRMQVRARVEAGQPVWEGVIEDITDRRRAEAAEREAEALRYVAHLASAAAHEINNPLSVITGRLELARKRLAGQEDTLAWMDAALEAARRIAEIVAHMGRITRLQMREAPSASVPPMLDIRGSGPSEPR
jgi:PAS domain S-box-containing protein